MYIYFLIMAYISVTQVQSLVWFSGLSTIYGYLIPNPIFTCILNIFVNTFYRYTQLKDQTVLFFMIQFSISQQTLMVPSITVYH